ncbi:hypothetical protein [Roseibium album]|uniref:hypothetical protein n=1 Tax=Roseibium album TaxID=311410 RepID=UPI00391DF2D8
MKIRIDIENLLKWAYCEELPKADPDGFGKGLRAGSAWQSVESYVQLLTKVDDNRFGVVPTLNRMEGDPHIDAVRVHAAVRKLDGLTLDFPDDWNPLPSIAEYPRQCRMVLEAARFGITNASTRPSDLVRKHALLGGCPVTNQIDPVLAPVLNGNGLPIWFQLRVEQSVDEDGRPVERKFETEDGWNRNTKTPKAGAYQKFYLDPDPTIEIISRGEYQIWRCCLSMIVEELAETLDKWRVVDTWRTSCPWEDTEQLGPVVLRDMRIFS